LIPFTYFLALFCIYETIFKKLIWFPTNSPIKKKVEYSVLKRANLNISKLYYIKKNMNLGILQDSIDIDNYIRSICKKTYRYDY